MMCIDMLHFRYLMGYIYIYTCIYVYNQFDADIWNCLKHGGSIYSPSSCLRGEMVSCQWIQGYPIIRQTHLFYHQHDDQDEDFLQLSCNRFDVARGFLGSRIPQKLEVFGDREVDTFWHPVVCEQQNQAGIQVRLEA